jgi:hydroxyacylglutathione hydrolase
MRGLSVLTVPAFDDNYLWLIHDGQDAVAVDPGDATPILAALEKHQLSLSAILLTHHHADHVGGVPGLLARFDVPVFGPRNAAITTITDRVGEGDTVTLPRPPLAFTVLEVPGHTLDHLAYHDAQTGWLFCGDTLFAGGCGRMFEGTPAQMSASLDRLAALPDATAVYCAHEYTLSNLRFAAEAEPGNMALQERIVREQAKRSRHEPTVPSTIALEKATNPFLRYREPAIIARLIASGKLAAVPADPAEGFCALREWKNVVR